MIFGVNVLHAGMPSYMTYLCFAVSSEYYQTTAGFETKPQRLEEALEVYMDECVAFNTCQRYTTFYLDLDTMSTGWPRQFPLD